MKTWDSVSLINLPSLFSNGNKNVKGLQTSGLCLELVTQANVLDFKKVLTKEGNWRLDAERFFLACHKWSRQGNLYLYGNLGLYVVEVSVSWLIPHNGVCKGMSWDSVPDKHFRVKQLKFSSRTKQTSMFFNCPCLFIYLFFLENSLRNMYKQVTKSTIGILILNNSCP